MKWCDMSFISHQNDVNTLKEVITLSQYEILHIIHFSAQMKLHLKAGLHSLRGRGRIFVPKSAKKEVELQATFSILLKCNAISSQTKSWQEQSFLIRHRFQPMGLQNDSVRYTRAVSEEPVLIIGNETLDLCFKLMASFPFYLLLDLVQEQI